MLSNDFGEPEASPNFENSYDLNTQLFKIINYRFLLL